MTYNRTAKEDLVGAGVLLPEHAPPEFADRAVLWNSVEKNEKAKNAQLARSLKYSLPNEWDEATARQVMERFIKEQFVDKAFRFQRQSQGNGSTAESGRAGKGAEPG